MFLAQPPFYTKPSRYFLIGADSGNTGFTNFFKREPSINITANGESVSYMVRRDSVKVGGVEANNVAAMIAPGLDGDVLLGMSYLGAWTCAYIKVR